MPDIIVLDLHLPDMSGCGVCCRLKAHAATAVIPVLHLSDAAESRVFDGHVDQGDEAYLTYPLESAESLSAVRALLRGRQFQRQFGCFLEVAPDAVVIADQDGKIVQVNGQAEARVGRGRVELIGRDVEVLLSERYRDTHRDQRAGYMARPATRLDETGSGYRDAKGNAEETDTPAGDGQTGYSDHDEIAARKPVGDR